MDRVINEKITISFTQSTRRRLPIGGGAVLIVCQELEREAGLSKV